MSGGITIIPAGGGSDGVGVLSIDIVPGSNTQVPSYLTSTALHSIPGNSFAGMLGFADLDGFAEVRAFLVYRGTNSLSPQATITPQYSTDNGSSWDPLNASLAVTTTSTTNALAADTGWYALDSGAVGDVRLAVFFSGGANDSQSQVFYLQRYTLQFR